MYEWQKSVQEMIDWLERNLTKEPTLIELSRQVGYSPFYCSAKFHEVAGTTLRAYVAGRRLCRSAVDIRDTDDRILDIALRYGYSSQEALTRAFVRAFGVTPAAYRKAPRPIALPVVRNVYFPEHFNPDEPKYEKEGCTMNENREFCLREAQVRAEYLPAHKYIRIREERAADYMNFWKYHDCDEVCGTIDSMRNVAHPVVGCHQAGWDKAGGEPAYLYGFGATADYDGPIPDGFEAVDIPAGYYLVFFHPPFDFVKDCGEVMGRVEKLAWSYDVDKLGFESKKARWADDGRPCYQRHYPEVYGYEVLRPVEFVK